MQYFKPAGDFFVGDCMPFYHDGVFRLFYLLDEGHHRALGGLGGHQWAQASTTNLRDWTHYPLAIPITSPEEGAICTGSVFSHTGTYYGFYATRLRDRRQHASLATSEDGIHFTKVGPNPLFSPPAGYSPYHFRDPVVFQDPEGGRFHMLVTAQLENYPIPGGGGCLAHLVSDDLLDWKEEEPFVIPGFPDVPECPDYFCWNGWYYLVFSNGGTARYRMSRHPLGPWTRPLVDTLDGGGSRVMKTAAFGADRRLGVSWIGTRDGDKDNGGMQFGGNVVFRELVQRADGTLGTRFPVEMVPGSREASVPTPVACMAGTACGPGCATLEAVQGMEAAVIHDVPRNFRLVAEVFAGTGPGVFGLKLRHNGVRGYDVCLNPAEQTVRLHNQTISRVTGLDQPCRLELVALDSVIDLCVDNRRCVVDRCPELQGTDLLLYAWDTGAAFCSLRIYPL